LHAWSPAFALLFPRGLRVGGGGPRRVPKQEVLGSWVPASMSPGGGQGAPAATRRAGRLADRFSPCQQERGARGSCHDTRCGEHVTWRTPRRSIRVGGSAGAHHGACSVRADADKARTVQRLGGPLAISVRGRSAARSPPNCFPSQVTRRGSRRAFRGWRRLVDQVEAVREKAGGLRSEAARRLPPVASPSPLRGLSGGVSSLWSYPHCPRGTHPVVKRPHSGA
jgi:hypothetical protein